MSQGNWKIKEEPITLFTLDIFKAPEKRNLNVLLSSEAPLPPFSQNFTQGLATSDTKGNVQLILYFSGKIQSKINTITVFGILLLHWSRFLIDSFNDGVIRGKALKSACFVLNEFSQIANIEPKLTKY